MIEMLTGQLGGETARQIGKQIGVDGEQIEQILPSVLGTLTGALARNTSQPEGAQALSEALAKDHDGSILDNLPEFIKDFQNGPGEAILGHILGNKRETVEQTLSQDSSLDAESIAKIFTMLAPVILGMLGKSQQEKGLDAKGLSTLLGREKQAAENVAPKATSIFSQLLDADGDGSVVDDVAKMGRSLLGKFLGGK